MRKQPLSPEEQVRRLERVVRHPTRWQLKRLVLELQAMLNRLEPLVERLEAQDEEMMAGLKLRVLRGGALKRTSENKTIRRAEKLGL